MSRIRGKNTLPELAVRATAHMMGYRFRLHRSDLPGTPDLVFPRLHTVIFVHGCFWHGHSGCPKGRLPKSKLEYWEPKIMENRARDRRNVVRLRKLGWHVGVVWQCEVKDLDYLRLRLRDILKA
jgi:DNA mismatch endonuclease, patch repair protein